MILLRPRQPKLPVVQCWHLLRMVAVDQICRICETFLWQLRKTLMSYIHLRYLRIQLLQSMNLEDVGEQAD